MINQILNNPLGLHAQQEVARQQDRVRAGAAVFQEHAKNDAGFVRTGPAGEPRVIGPAFSGLGRAGLAPDLHVRHVRERVRRSFLIGDRAP